jgi:hypothetical protein
LPLGERHLLTFLKIYNSAAICGKFKNEIEKKVFLGHQASVTFSRDLEYLQTIRQVE